ncbi:MAG: DNA-directed RNA polymerase specialized sigma24 family protein, partial [Planctomycetota bacterium]
LERWHEDGRLLRDWLRVGLIFWAREFTRRENKQRGIPSLPDSIIGEEREPHEKMQNAFAANITRLAMEETAEACRAAGQEPHWRAFCLHYYEGLSYRAVGSELGLTDTQAEVRAHAPRRRFRRALRGHLQRDGIAPENLDRELKALIDDLRLK